MDFAASGASTSEGPLADLLELREKYDLLVALHAAGGGRTVERRDAMRRIADRFPGALREGDCLQLEALRQRREIVLSAAAAAARGEAPAALREDGLDWLRYAMDLHRALRELLHLRRWLRARGPAGPIDEEAAAAASASCGRPDAPPGAGPLSVARLAQIAAPPEGRLADLAYAEVAGRHGVSVAAVKQALFQATARAAARGEE